MLAGGLVIAGGGGVAAYTATQSNENEYEPDIEDRTVSWGGRGGEHATIECDGTATWNWILTRGGRDPIESGAELTVTFADESEVTVEGRAFGQSEGTVHFDVEKEDGGTVEDAEVDYTGGPDTMLLLNDGECIERDSPPPDPDPEAEVIYWAVQFGEGEHPPIPPTYWPDDGLFAVGNTADGVTENPLHFRANIDGQLNDVIVKENRFQFDDPDDPTEVSVTFAVDSGGEPRDLHLSIFTMPGPYDQQDVEHQDFWDAISAEYAGGERGTLSLKLPTQEDLDDL